MAKPLKHLNVTMPPVRSDVAFFMYPWTTPEIAPQWPPVKQNKFLVDTSHNPTEIT